MGMRITSRVSMALIGAAIIGGTAGVMATAGPCAGSLGASGWLCDTVDASGDVGSPNLLVYGRDGEAQVAYNATVGTRNTALKYARRDATGRWVTQVLDSSVGDPQSLLINPVTGQPAVAYGCLKLAEFNGTAWTTQTVVKNCDPSRSSLAFDTAGTAYAAYSQISSNSKTWSLRVGKRTGGLWTFNTLAVQASYMSLAIAPDGLPSIAFENRAGSLVYGHQTLSGSWQFTTVDTNSVIVAWVTLRFSATGTPSIAYRLGDDVRLATLDPMTNAWSREAIYTRTGQDYFAGIALTFANGEPVVTWGTQDPSGTLTFAAARRALETGTWTTRTIDVMPGTYVIQASASYNPVAGLVGVSYGPRGTSSNDLKFAEGSPGSIAP